MTKQLLKFWRNIFLHFFLNKFLIPFEKKFKVKKYNSNEKPTQLRVLSPQQQQ